MKIWVLVWTRDLLNEKLSELECGDYENGEWLNETLGKREIG